MARPQIVIDKKQFEQLCALFCTLDDISAWFKCSPDTIERWCKRSYKAGFAETIKRYSANAKTSLRRKQLDLAIKGNVTLLIWLGKQYLDQKEKTQISSDEVKPFALAYTITDLKKREPNNG